MTFTRSRSLSCAAMGLVIASFATPPAMGQVVSERTTVAPERQETRMQEAIVPVPLASQDRAVLIGTTLCSADAIATNLSVEFRSTHHFADGLTASALSGPSTSCADLLSSVRQLLTELGCVVGPQGSLGIPNFQFVCEGSTAQMVHVVGEVHRGALAVAEPLIRH